MAKSQYPYLLDVRSREEWVNNHVEGSHHIPINELLGGKLPDIPKSTSIYTFCRSGNRSEVAREYLVKNDFTNVQNIKTLEQARKMAQQ